jgi:hypothetical protein
MMLSVSPCLNQSKDAIRPCQGLLTQSKRRKGSKAPTNSKHHLASRRDVRLIEEHLPIRLVFVDQNDSRPNRTAVSHVRTQMKQ